MKRDIDERFWEKVQFEDPIFPENGCMFWTARFHPKGYGMFRGEKTMHRAYRWIYERLSGPVPKGLELDHLCRVRRCVNPDHLEPVTHKVNCERGDWGDERRSYNGSKTHCIHGHEFTPENIKLNQHGHRACRECHRINRRKYYALSKGG